MQMILLLQLDASKSLTVCLPKNRDSAHRERVTRWRKTNSNDTFQLDAYKNLTVCLPKNRDGTNYSVEMARNKFKYFDPFTYQMKITRRQVFLFLDQSHLSLPVKQSVEQV